jgi:hypothetical protein
VSRLKYQAEPVTAPFEVIRRKSHVYWLMAIGVADRGVVRRISLAGTRTNVE